MEWLLKKAEEFLDRYNYLRRWRKVLAVLMTIVVFGSTYAMILPAITLETDGGEAIGVFADSSSDESLPEEESTVTDAEPDETETCEAEPVYLDNEKLIFENENLCLSLTVTAAAMIPADAELSVREVGQVYADDGLDDEGRENEYLSYLAAAEEELHFTEEQKEYIEKTVLNGPAADVPWFRFFVLSINNADGTVVPACKLTAEIIYRNLDETAADGLNVVCLGSDGKMVLADSEVSVSDTDISVKFMDEGQLAFGTFAMDPVKDDEAIEESAEELPEDESVEESVEELPEDESVEESAEELPEDESVEESAEELPEDESVVETVEAEPEEIAEESPEEEEQPEKTLTAVGADYVVTMTYSADAKIPEGAVLTAEEILEDDSAYEDYMSDAAAALDVPEERTSRVRARFFDIKIMVGENEIEPAAPVRVDISYAAPQEMAAAENVSAVHFAEEGKEPEVVEITDVTTDEQTEEVNGVSFDADSFSVYGVVYTVDFEWEVDGKTYEFSIPGGGYASLYNLVESLGIAAEAAKEFVADVENVIFSRPDLVWVGKIDTADTVGAIKTANGLTCTYSLDLTSSEIEDINSRTVEAGDWLLISIQPFASEETLTVTMKDGEQFIVKVTDNQINDFSSLETNEKYVLYIEVDGVYYALDGNGNTVEVADNDLDHLSSEYLWKFSSQENGTSHYANASTWVNGTNYLDVYWTDKENPVVATSGGWQPIVTLVPVTGGGYYFRDLNPDRHTYNYPYPYSYMTYDLYQHRYLIDDYDDTTGTHNIKTAFGEEYNAYYGDSYSDAVVIYVYKQGSSYDITAKTNNTVFGQVNYTYDGSTLTTSVSADSFTVETENSVEENKTALSYFTAVPETGYKFTGWTVLQVNAYDEYQVVSWGDGCTEASASVKPTVDGNIILKANFEPEKLYNFTIQTNDQNMGTVGGGDAEGTVLSNQVSFQSISGVVIDDKGTNAYDITAVRKPLYKFEKWILTDSQENETEIEGATIPAGTLELTEDNMTLTAIFAAKTDTEIDETDIDVLLGDWKKSMTGDFTGVDKTAHVSDYENRIYEIDLTASSLKWTTDQSITLDFITDTSRSMYFPANLEQVGTFTNLSSWLTDADKNTTYYVISDDDSATMYAVHYDTSVNKWLYIDSSYYYNTDGATRTYKVDGKTVEGVEVPTQLQASDSVSKKKLKGIIYKSATAPTSYQNRTRPDELEQYWSRLDYLYKAVMVATETLKSIDPNATVHLTTFNKASKSVGVLKTNETAIYSDNLKNIAPDGGTRQDEGLYTSRTGENRTADAGAGDTTGVGSNSAFEDDSENKQFAILITDGAPNATSDIWGTKNDEAGAKTIFGQAKALKEITDIYGNDLTLMTLGLSLNFVGETNRTNLADISSDPNQYAKEANNGGEIVRAIKELVQNMISKAELFGTVSDTLDPAFYPVDKDGNPVAENIYYDMDGNECTLDDETPCYRWTKNGEVWTITYYNQTFKWPTLDTAGNITANGWEQAFYVKAKEDFLGGNTIETNGKTEGSTAFTATHTITLDDDGKEIAGSKKEIKDSNNETTTIVKNDISTPHVNVKQLTLDGNETEWTVYIETEVDPLPQIKELYNNIEVLEVVDASTNNMITSNEAMLFDPGEGTDPETFLLKDAIGDLTDDDWDDLIQADDGDDGTVDIPYTKYGHTTGVIRLTLTKEGEKAEYGEHTTSSALTDIEEYVLTAQFIPYTAAEMTASDSGVEPGDDHLYHTTTDQSPGTEQQAGKPCDNIHVIDLLVRGISITKTDENFIHGLPGAEFMVYRLATADEIANESDIIKTFDGEQYYPDHSLDFDDNGVAYKNGVKALGSTTKYYLVETKAPNGYVLLEDPIPVQLTITDVYTKMPVEEGTDPVTSTEKPASGLYNWEQKAKLELLGDSGFIRTTGAYDPSDATTDLTHTAIEATSLYEVMYYRISNNPGIELPATGGPGTAMLYLIGLAMVSFAGGGILMKRKAY